MPLGASRLSYLALTQAVAAPAVLAQRQSTILSAVGDAQVSTTQSKFGGASGLFDGTGDYLTADSFTLDGDFTVEAWIYPAGVSGNSPIFATDDFIFTVASAVGGFYRLQFFDGSSNVLLANAFTTLNQWYHFAVVRSGTTIKGYVDGVEVDSGTYSASSTSAYIGYSGGIGGTTYWNGYIDDLRVSDTARYTSGFTPSTTAFDNDANTLLLTHMNGTSGSTKFLDDTGNRTRIGLSGINDAQISLSQKKFGGASALFDGTGDAVLLNTPILPATDDWTVEMWVYPTSIGGTDYFFAQYSAGSAGRTTLYMNGSGQVGLFINGGPSFTSTGTLSASTWQHIAWVRNGSDFKIYIDGTEDGSGTGSPSVQQINSVLGAQDSSGSNGFIGYIDEVRVSSNARYTTAFTPSTTPLINDANTLMLSHMDGENGSADFVDDNQIVAESTGFAIDATGVTGYDLWWPQSAMHGSGSDSNVTFALLNVDTSGRATHSVLASTYDFSGENISSTTQSGTFLNPVSRGGEIATNGDADGVVCGRDNASDNAKLVGYTISNFGTTSSSTAPTISTPSSATTFDDNNGEWTTTVAYSNGYWVAGNNNNSNRQAVQMFTSSGGGAPSSYNTQYTSATIALNEHGESVGFNNGLSANNSLLFLHDRDSVNFKFAIYTANSSGTSELIVTGPSINTSRDRIGKCKDASNDWRAIKMARDAADGYMYVAGANCTAFGTPGSVNPTVSTSTNKTLVYPGTLNNSNIVQGQFDGESFLVYETGGVIYCRRLFYAGGTADVQVGEIIPLGEHGLSAGYMTAVSYTHTDNTFVICGGVRDNTGAKVHPFGARI